MKRRTFIKNTVLASTGLSVIPSEALASKQYLATKITILHTNDVHSQIEPFDKNHAKFPNMGGAARRAHLIEKVRRENEHVLVLDSGDMFQGTPYFNYFGGELEFKLMSMMGYDVATLGNHDFDNGISGLLSNLPYAKFDLVNSNYNFENSELKGKIKPYVVKNLGGIKIGIFGIGIELKGLVEEKNYNGIEFFNPIDSANKTALFLKKNKCCDYIICLSHLGLEYNDDAKISDLKLAEQTQNIDLILGGHTHSFLDNIIIKKNLINQNVIINQVGAYGIYMGKIDLDFNKNGNHSSSILS